MNPLTQIKGIQKLNSREAALGISEDASWHAKYKDSAYVFVGGIPYDLTEGDLLAIFAQYGEIVDVNLVRDKASGKSKGFAFVAYEDQRSTILAVDNLNGAQIIGRTIRVDHVGKYKKKEEEEEEDEETKRKKREERGVCRAFQRGECKWGAECKFSHDEQRAANTGWGHEEDLHSRQVHNKFGGGGGGGIPDKRPFDIPSGRDRDYGASKSRKVDGRDERGGDKRPVGIPSGRDRDYGASKSRKVDDRDERGGDIRSSGNERESYDREDHGRREEKRSRRPGKEDYERRDIQDERDREKRSSHSRDSSSWRHRDRDNDDRSRSRR